MNATPLADLPAAPDVVANADEVLDGRGCLATPGLVNTHHHLYQWATRGLAQQDDLFGWLTTLYPVWEGLDEDVVGAAAAAGAVQASPDLLDLALTGGDDYEILCTVPENKLDSFRKQADSVGIPLSVIGRVVAGHDLPVFRMNGLERRFDVGSYQHF